MLSLKEILARIKADRKYLAPKRTLDTEPAKKSKRSATTEKQKIIWRLALIVAILIALLAAPFVLDRTSDRVARFMDRLLPGSHTLAEVQTTLNNVRLPNSINVVEGQGTGSATLETTAYAFNQHVPGAGSHTQVNIAGTITLVVPSEAIKLHARHIQGGWQTEAVVDVTQLQVTKDTHTTDQIATDGLGRRVGSVLTGGNMDAKLQMTEEYATSSFQNSCAQPLTSALPAGVEAYLRSQLRSTQNALSGVKPDDASVLGELAAQTVIITLTNGGKPIPPESVTLPQLPMPSDQTVADKIGAKRGEVKIAADKGCSLSPRAEALLRDYKAHNRQGGK